MIGHETLTSAADTLLAIPRLVREVMDCHQLSYRALATRAGIAPSTLFEVVHGRNMTTDTAVLVLRWLARETGEDDTETWISLLDARTRNALGGVARE